MEPSDIREGLRFHRNPHTVTVASYHYYTVQARDADGNYWYCSISVILNYCTETTVELETRKKLDQ